MLREDQSLFTNSTEVPVVSGNTSTYAASDVAVTKEGDTVRIDVGDALGVSITRLFAGELQI